ncbi:hypothetical protein HK405_006464, partial [Cladochytrium tenue]
MPPTTGSMPVVILLAVSAAVAALSIAGLPAAQAQATSASSLASASLSSTSSSSSSQASSSSTSASSSSSSSSSKSSTSSSSSSTKVATTSAVASVPTAIVAAGTPSGRSGVSVAYFDASMARIFFIGGTPTDSTTTTVSPIALAVTTSWPTSSPLWATVDVTSQDGLTDTESALVAGGGCSAYVSQSVFAGKRTSPTGPATYLSWFGVGSDGSLLSADIFSFTPDTGVTSDVRSYFSSAPPARQLAACVTLDYLTAFVHGGIAAASYSVTDDLTSVALGDTYYLDLAAVENSVDSWTSMSSAPPAMFAHKAALVPDGTLFLVGGISVEHGLAQLVDMGFVWRYDPQAGYAKFPLTSNSIYLPDGRIGHSLVVLNSSSYIYMFGGRNLDGSVVYSDLWQLDIYNLDWTLLHNGSVPARYDHVAVNVQGSMVVAFGTSAGGSTLPVNIYNPPAGSWVSGLPSSAVVTPGDNTSNVYPSAKSDGQTSGSNSLSSTQWIIVGTCVGAAVLLAIAIGAVIANRRRKLPPKEESVRHGSLGRNRAPSTDLTGRPVQLDDARKWSSSLNRNISRASNTIAGRKPGGKLGKILQGQGSASGELGMDSIPPPVPSVRLESAEGQRSGDEDLPPAAPPPDESPGARKARNRLSVVTASEVGATPGSPSVGRSRVASWFVAAPAEPTPLAPWELPGMGIQKSRPPTVVSTGTRGGGGGGGVDPRRTTMLSTRSGAGSTVGADDAVSLASAYPGFTTVGARGPAHEPVATTITLPGLIGELPEEVVGRASARNVDARSRRTAPRPSRSSVLLGADEAAAAAGAGQRRSRQSLLLAATGPDGAPVYYVVPENGELQQQLVAAPYAAAAAAAADGSSPQPSSAVPSTDGGPGTPPGTGDLLLLQYQPTPVSAAAAAAAWYGGRAAGPLGHQRPGTATPPSVANGGVGLGLSGARPGSRSPPPSSPTPPSGVGGVEPVSPESSAAAVAAGSPTSSGSAE